MAHGTNVDVVTVINSKRNSMKKFIVIIMSMLMLVGCGSTVQPSVGSGEVSDETLSKNTVSVGLFTFQEVQNNYGYIPNNTKDYR